MDKKLIREFDGLERKYKLLFVALGVLIVSCIVYCFYKDIVASHDGYGDLVTEVVDGGEENEVLGWVLAILPTLIQLAFWVAMVGDIKLVNNTEMFRSISYICTAFDCVMDIVAYYDGTIVSIIAGSVLTVVVYTLFSEMMFAWIVPTLGAMIGATFGETIDESSPERVRAKSGIDSAARRMASFARPAPTGGDRMRAVRAGARANGRDR